MGFDSILGSPYLSLESEVSFTLAIYYKLSRKRATNGIGSQYLPAVTCFFLLYFVFTGISYTLTRGIILRIILRNRRS